MTDTVAVHIDGKQFQYWSRLSITRSIDTFSTIEFSAPFEAERFEFRDTFRPFTFKPLTATLDGETFFTGTMVGIEPDEDEEKSEVAVSGYSLPGVLGDCNVPERALPLEFKKQRFRDILDTLCGVFGLGLDVRVDTGPPFEKVALEVDDKPLKVLADLAKQRSLVLSDTSDGHVLCWRSVTDGAPVAEFSGQPLQNIKPEYNAQEYFSEVTGYTPPRRKRKGSKFTAPNPWLRERLRPMSFKMDDTEKGDAVTACQARLGRMFANMMSLTVSNIPTWRDPQGKVWSPNTIVTVHQPNAMIYAPTRFLVRDVTLVQDADKQTAELNLVLPGAFSGEIPRRLPWDEPQNPDDPLSAYEATL